MAVILLVFCCFDFFLHQKTGANTPRTLYTGCSVIVWTLFVEQINQISGRGEGLTKQ
jgi:ABC-type polysaccharide/polyol phosphate export permease